MTDMDASDAMHAMMPTYVFNRLTQEQKNTLIPFWNTLNEGQQYRLGQALKNEVLAEPDLVHLAKNQLDSSRIYTACGTAMNPHQTAWDPRDVTCTSCKSTKRYHTQMGIPK